MNQRSEVETLKHSLVLCAEDLCRRLLPAGKREGSDWTVGSVQGEPGQSLHVQLDGRFAGKWRDWATGERGDLLDLIGAAERLGFPEAIHWAMTWMGSSSAGASEPYRSRPAKVATSDSNRQKALELWHRSQPAAGTLVETYLWSRGLTGLIPESLRFLPIHRHPSGDSYPVMLAAVQNVAGAITAVHRTYLRRDGRGKAPVATGKPKMMLGPVAGGCVRLACAGPRLGIAEGIETALSVVQAVPGLPVWAALSAPGIERSSLPGGVREVVLLGDGDETGRVACERAARRFHAEGRLVSVAFCPESLDFNDVLMEAEDDQWDQEL